MGKNFLIFLFFIGTIPSLHSQLFEYQYDSLIQSAKSGLAIGVSDVNFDGREDIVRFRNSKELELLLCRPGGQFESVFRSSASANSLWNVLLYDQNKDGIQDMIASGNHSGTHYWISGSHNSFQHFRDQNTSFFGQASNLVDINGDNIPDIFICNDLGENIALDGSSPVPFEIRSDWVPSNLPSGLSAGNYGSVWEDINRDGIPDLYIAKCIQGIFDPSDPRRINQLFLSGETGFEEKTEEWNVTDSSQSWAASFADVNNDELMDLFVINHDAPSRLFVNQGDSFSRAENFSESSLQFSNVQILPADFNCDGWVDFLITGEYSVVLINNGDLTFTESRDAFGLYSQTISSASMGDFNRDGYLDVFAARHQLYNNSGPRSDALFFNRGGDNHWLKISLLSDSIFTNAPPQTKINIYGDFGVQSRTYRVGESYGITQSNTIHFGLGAHEHVDSVEISWPNGDTSKYFGFIANQSYIITRGKGFTVEHPPINSSQILCGSDSILLDGLDHLTLKHWYKNDQKTDSTKVKIDGDGTYHGVWQDSVGNWYRLPSFSIPLATGANQNVAVTGSRWLCAEDTVMARAMERGFIGWNDGVGDPVRRIESAGEYFPLYFDGCDTVEGEMILFEPSARAAAPIISSDTVKMGETATLFKLEGEGEIYWYSDSVQLDLMATGDSLQVENVEMDQEFYARTRSRFSAQTEVIGEMELKNSPYQHGDFFNGEMNFIAKVRGTLDTVTVFTEDSGNRSFRLIGEQGLIYSDTFSIDSGQTDVPLSWEIHPGLYAISTDIAINIEEFETYSPQLLSTASKDLKYPYGDPQIFQILGNNTSLDQYFYFYNWRFTPTPYQCNSPFATGKIILESGTHSPHAEQRPQVQLFPNPTRDQFYLKLPEGCNPSASVSLLDAAGNTTREWNHFLPTQKNFSIPELTAGLYFVKVKCGSDLWVRPLVIK